MRMVILLSVAVTLAIFSVANGAVAMANAGGGAFAGPGGAFAGPGVGTFAGPGMMFSNMFPGLGGQFPFRFNFPTITPWYLGENVCKDVKDVSGSGESDYDEDEEGMGNVQTGMSSESCRGNNNVYICRSTTGENGVTKTVVTKYKCCQGFVRPFNGAPGCVSQES